MRRGKGEQKQGKQEEGTGIWDIFDPDFSLKADAASSCGYDKRRCKEENNYALMLNRLPLILVSDKRQEKREFHLIPKPDSLLSA